jgi:hypothetical protein
MHVETTVQRLKAAAALLLTAFFAAAGAFHHHELPRSSHDHAGFCSAASVSIGLESCALCRVAQTSAHESVGRVAPFALEATSLVTVIAVFTPASAGCIVLSDPRAPPTV